MKRLLMIQRIAVAVVAAVAVAFAAAAVVADAHWPQFVEVEQK